MQWKGISLASRPSFWLPKKRVEDRIIRMLNILSTDLSEKQLLFCGELQTAMLPNVSVVGNNLNLGNYLKSKTFRERREVLRYAMLQVFYNKTEGAWFDYNLRTKSHNTNYYPSVAVPLFTECYQPLNLAKPQHIVEYLNVCSLN